ncbi:hypothetical protein BKA70DRAFT_1193506 [Coprinopsis sp. MPI-PUGE-AT-0042]|nr:hypothetical protein BKA70DRAFT_1193506 [Coprinopsis sp. MPI-PUGE-AT-0042]
MGELVNVVVAFAVIIFLFRWITSGSDGSDDQRQAALGFRPKTVSQQMINTVSGMFPDIPVCVLNPAGCIILLFMQAWLTQDLCRPNIHYDLLRTGSVEQTTNKVLERGFLEAPPAAFHTLYPQSSNANGSGGATTGTASSKPAVKPASLVERYKLEERVKTGEVVDDSSIGGKAQWEESAEKREASLRERKAQMILAARQRFLAQQQAKAAA